MKPALVLFAYAAVLAVAAPALLRRADWPQRAPRLAIAVWQVLGASTLLAVVLGGLALAVPTVAVSTDLGVLLRACAMALQVQYAGPGGAALSATGLTLAAGVAARCLYCAAATLAGAARQRRVHREALALVGRPAAETGVTVVEHAAPAAYCLPGPGARVVLTSSALAALAPCQLAAVLAHERAHLRGRHHWVLAGADAAARAFPRVPLFAVGREQVGRLVEMLADDRASRTHDRLDIAAALITLGRGGAPAAALAASGASAPDRVRRLLGPARPLRQPAVAAAALLAAAISVTPLVVAAAPAVAAVNQNLCPITAAPY